MFSWAANSFSIHIDAEAVKNKQVSGHSSIVQKNIKIYVEPQQIWETIS